MTRTAALVTGHAKRWPAWRLRSTRGGIGPITFPQIDLKIYVEILINNEWIDISRYVMWSDKVVITRGRRPGMKRAPAATCRFRLRNSDRRFSPRNAEGPYYGSITRNVRMRVSVDAGSGRHVRFTGEIPDLAPRWSMGEARFINVVARARRQRVEADQDRVVSPMSISVGFDGPPFWWPLEDENGAIEAASGVVGGPVMSTTDATFGGSAILPGASGSMVIGSEGTFTARVNWEPPNSRWQIDFHHLIPNPPDDDVVVMEVITTGTVMIWRYIVGANGDTYKIRGYAADNTLLVDQFLSAGDNFVGQPIHPRLYVRQSGADVDWGFTYTLSLGGVFWIDGGTTVANANLGKVARIGVHRFDANLAGTSYSHIVLYDAFDFTQSGLPAFGHVGETVDARFQRLSFEAGFSQATRQTLDEHLTMGVQQAGTISSVLDEIESAGASVIDDDFDDNTRLTLRSWLYNRPIDLTLSYAPDGETSDVIALETAAESVGVVNDVTVQRPSGSSARAVKDSGINSTQAPDLGGLGIGRMPAPVETVNTETDFLLRRHASYRMEAGTVDALRWDNIGIDLARKPALIPGWLQCDTGSRIQVLEPPADVGGDTLDQIIEGYVEELTQRTWTAEIHTSPADIHNVWIVGDTRRRLDCGGTTLDEALTTTETLIDVYITDRCVWTHDDGDYVITVRGEDMRVRAVSAVSGTYPDRFQTLTVVRSINGVVKSHSAGYPVHVRHPYRVAL